MANKNGWWSFSTNVDPSDCDLEHIAEMIKQGYTSGEICIDDEEDEEENITLTTYALEYNEGNNEMNFTVPKLWAKEIIKERFNMSLTRFLDEYTYDDTEIIYDEAEKSMMLITEDE